MIPLATLQELFDYNYWARDRQLDACARLTLEQFLRPLGSSFSSVRDTLAHLLASEWIWLEAWRGSSPTARARDREQFAPERFSTVAALRDRWIAMEHEMRSFLAALTDERLAQPFTWTRMTGETKTFTLWRTLYHVLNHQTYHRGQITTLRQLGAQPAPVDFGLFADARAGQ